MPGAGDEGAACAPHPPAVPFQVQPGAGALRAEPSRAGRRGSGWTRARDGRRVPAEHPRAGQPLGIPPALPGPPGSGADGRPGCADNGDSVVGSDAHLLRVAFVWVLTARASAERGGRPPLYPAPGGAEAAQRLRAVRPEAPLGPPGGSARRRRRVGPHRLPPRARLPDMAGWEAPRPATHPALLPAASAAGVSPYVSPLNWEQRGLGGR